MHPDFICTYCGEQAATLDHHGYCPDCADRYRKRREAITAVEAQYVVVLAELAAKRAAIEDQFGFAW